MIANNLLISDYPLDSPYVIFCDHFFPKIKNEEYDFRNHEI